MSSQTYNFEVEMTCEGCAIAVKRVLSRLGGDVSSVNTDVEKNTVTMLIFLNIGHIPKGWLRLSQAHRTGQLVWRFEAKGADLVQCPARGGYGYLRRRALIWRSVPLVADMAI
ncbi:hypothetical protein TcWFU_005327 [Taenia crassiceps]|uniref:HMA domain-containing protein n=1 Tax=Taenia crassiceps TaxID=6207 RepID=A0ABR4QKN4_9CEST